MTDAYAAAGVDTRRAGRGVDALVEVLSAIDTGRERRTVPLPGHFASVVRVGENLGLALATDSVGSKVIVAEQAGRFDTIGIDCVAMNVNDLICVGAEPVAMLDYLAVERADAERLRQLALGLRVGAQAAGVEIPGGEVCQLPEVIRGHPSPYGFDLVGSAFGTVALDRIVDGSACRPGDALIGLPATGIHSNGLTLARRALAELPLEAAPDELLGQTVADALLEPTAIYVRAVLGLLESGHPVHGLVHITGDGVLNLLRIGSGVGYEISSPLPAPPVFGLIGRLGHVAPAEMWEVFNMGCGFCAIVAETDAPAAVELLSAYHPGTAVIGRLTDAGGRLALPTVGLEGDASGLRTA
ncbi:MAG: phosphoribosylformylglycinamidine cyclo-ligase [Chloroflexi bacterium]|nr:phosphoribosylformylglycinamidine cyclo-ligase [Chloroflexota bacterium]